ncbi:MAG: recombination-associated protein RdgC [Gammaproteobacteria bacterium]|nr:recombination-associated protein RdgC [Gammaproteobacteria bacterium]
MFFRNLVVHRLPADDMPSAPELEERLAQRTLQPCGPFDMASRGWVAPAAGSARLVYTVGLQHLIALGVDQKLLPASVIRQVTTERAAVLAIEQGFPVGRRQMRDLRLRVTEELRSRALTKRRMTRAWIDPQNGWLVVDAAGAARAEEFVEALRDTLGSFAVQRLEAECSPQASMALWLRQGDAPLRFTIEQDLELQAPDRTKAVIRYTRYPLESREILAHLSAGLCATRLGLTWNDRVSFILTEKLQLKRIEFLEMKKDAADGGEADAAEQFDIDFAVMAGELAALLSDLTQALGEARPQAEAA